MSTTFGVIRPGYNLEDANADEEGFIEIAFRGGSTRWKNELAPLLPNDTPVYPLDNCCDDIKTIGDLKKIIKDAL